MYKIYCLLVIHVGVILATNEKITEPLPVAPCEYVYNPVCGSDGITYMNDCVLDSASSLNTQDKRGPITKVSNGECSTCICQQVDLPVCTLEGLTFPNECELACENINRMRSNKPILQLAYRAGCIGPSTGCTDLAAPVCGTDNIMYRNKCVLDTANSISIKRGGPSIAVKNNGACLETCLCPLEHQPVCGTNGYFYENVCYLGCQNKLNQGSPYPYINIADRSVCELCYCLNIDNPVCGSDGRSYKNACYFDCESKKMGTPNLRIVSYGLCSGCYCTEDYIPVCGTDLNTYTNECQLKCANDKRVDGYPISVLHQGECQPKGCNCNAMCPPQYEPVCGSDGRTYWNICWLKCNANCSTQNSQQKTLFLNNNGACYM